ncbi:MAG: hypothetical protein B655_1617 [Methanobacterium sp. Maddingley MBC34]|nr:MAG: hypothetical protein B655_1617 [Methanobacterium sp. Maddingley MBC34]
MDDTFCNKSFSGDIRLLIILSVYFILGIFLLKYYQYQINPDGIQYILIAKSYFTGNFHTAIDAYWGPLISWLLVPFLFFGQSPIYELLSTKILALIVGSVTIVGVRFLSYRFKMNETIRTVLLFSLIPIILFFALFAITPDLLTVCVLVYYLYFIFDPDYYQKYNNAIFCGILGSLAYFSKSFALPFFLIHFFIFNIFHVLAIAKNRRRKVVKNFLLGVLVFVLISGIWVALISDKEGKITIGTSGEVNHALVGPDSKGPVQFFKGFDKPQISVSNPQWSPLNSWSNFKFQLEIIWNNIQKELLSYQLFSLFSIIIMFTYFLLCLKPLKQLINDRDVLYPLTTIILLSVLYLPIVVEASYLWLGYILLLLMAGFLINIILEKTIISKIAKIILLFVVAASFAYMPVSFLANNTNINKELYYSSLDLKTQYNINGNIASNDQLDTMKFISFYMGTNYYGQAPKNITDDQLASDLKELDIDYYFVWDNSINNSSTEGNLIANGYYLDIGDSAKNSKILTSYEPSNQGKMKYFKIYAVKE